ncbi:zinc finger protein 54-like isoform X1 [Cherax quadricarinatus]
MVKRFFRKSEWENLSSIEHTRCYNVYRNYKMLNQLGLETRPPDFVLRYNNRQTQRQERHQKRQERHQKRQERHQRRQERSEKTQRPERLRALDQRNWSNPSFSLNHRSLQRCSKKGITNKTTAKRRHTLKHIMKHNSNCSPVLKKDEIKESGILEARNGMDQENCRYDMKDQEGTVQEACPPIKAECKAQIQSSKINFSQNEVKCEKSITATYFKCFNGRDMSFEDCDVKSNQTKANFNECSSINISKCLPDGKLKHKDSRVEKSHGKLKSKGFKCYVCGHKIFNKWNFIAHFKTHMDKKHFGCDECGQKFSKFSYLRKHLLCVTAETTDGRYKCSYCNHTFLRDSNRKNHELIHSQTEMVPCCLCELQFSNVKSVRNHAQKVHSKDKCFKCLLCGASYYNAGHLKRHLKEISMDLPYYCSTCSHKYATAGGLKRHNCNTGNLKSFSCPYCLTIFSNRSHLKRHVANRRKVKQYQCSDCKMEFLYLGDLRRHQEVHNKDRPFKCSQCRHSFDSIGRLHGHERMHTERGWKCMPCGETFKKKSYLKTHEQIHSGASLNLVEIGGNKRDHMQGFQQLSLTKELRRIRFMSPKKKDFHQTLTHEESQIWQEYQNHETASLHNFMITKDTSSHFSSNRIKCTQKSQLVHASNNSTHNLHLYLQSQQHGSSCKTESDSEIIDPVGYSNLDDTQARDSFIQGVHHNEQAPVQPSFYTSNPSRCIDEHRQDKHDKESACDLSPFLNFSSCSFQEKLPHSASSVQSYKPSKHRQCTVCNIEISCPSNFVRHMQLHTGIRLHECQVCKTKFTRSDNLSRHMERSHNKQENLTAMG